MTGRSVGKRSVSKGSKFHQRRTEEKGKINTWLQSTRWP